MVDGDFCALSCFALFPGLVALLAFYKGRRAVALFCLVSILFGVGPLVALLTLFKLCEKKRLLNLSLLVLVVVIMYILFYLATRYAVNISS